MVSFGQDQKKDQERRTHNFFFHLCTYIPGMLFSTLVDR